MDIRKRFSILLFAFVLSLGACVNDKLSAEGGQQFPKVKVIHVKDGDSFVVLTSQHEKEEVRLIDAPELHQAFGRQAKQYLSKLIKGKFIVIDFEKKDRYQRLLAKVYLDDLYINEEMIRAGYAWHFDRFNTNDVLQTLEDSARSARVGLWQDSQPMAPWNWRKRNKRY